MGRREDEQEIEREHPTLVTPFVVTAGLVAPTVPVSDLTPLFRGTRSAFASTKGPVRDVFARARWAVAHPDALGYLSLEHALRSVRGEPEPSSPGSA